MKILSINKSSFIVHIFVLIIFLQNCPWPLWEIWFPVLCVCTLTLSFLLSQRIIDFPINKNIFLITFFLISFFLIFQAFQKFRTSSLITIFIFLFLFYLTTNEKIKIIDKITSFLSLIILISLPLWLINQFIFELPLSYEMHYGTWKGDAGLTVLQNYYFFIQEKHGLLNRFYSVFDEPGTLGTLSAFLLFANKYNLKDKRNIVILLGGFFTYSLAFFVLSTVGLILCNIKKLKAILGIMVGFSIFIGTILYLFKDNQIFNNVIAYRIINSEDAMGYRNSDEIKSYFANYIKSPDAILGKGTSFFMKNPSLAIGRGASYIDPVIENGFIGILIIICMYLFIKKENKYLHLSYLILFLLSFLQRPSLFTPWELIIYYTGLANLSTYK